MFHTFIYVPLLLLTFLTILYRCDSNDRDDDKQPGVLERPRTWLCSHKAFWLSGRRRPASTVGGRWTKVISRVSLNSATLSLSSEHTETTRGLENAPRFPRLWGDLVHHTCPTRCRRPGTGQVQRKCEPLFLGGCCMSLSSFLPLHPNHPHPSPARNREGKETREDRLVWLGRGGRAVK